LIQKRVTIEDIAQEVGFSANTVSRALNERGEIRLETKNTILEAAHRLGYHPNRLAQRLRQNRTGIIGVVVADNSNPFFAAVVKGIESAAAVNDYSIILKDSNETPETEQESIQVMLAEQVDGLIIAPVRDQKEDLAALIESRFPIVAIARYPKGWNSNYVVVDNVRAGYLATSHLLDRGYQRIALINGPASELSAEDRFKGYAQALSERGIELDMNLVSYGATTMEQGYERGKELLATENPPTAVHAFSDYVALGFIRAARETSIRIPDDVAIVGFDDIAVSAYLAPSLSTISVPIKEMGKKAAEILLANIDSDKEVQLFQLKLDPKLVARESS